MWGNTALARMGWWWVLVCCLAASPALRAHPTLDSQVVLDFQSDAVRANLRMPLPDLLAAQPDLVTQGVDPMVGLDDAALRHYVSAHFSALSAEGVAWETRIIAWQVLPSQNPELPPVVDVTVQLQPDRLPFDRVTVRADFISHEVHNHSILVLLRSDWDAGVATQTPVLLGSLGHERTLLNVDRKAIEPYAAWRSMVFQGAQHIVTGYDHLLFLALVLLAACLVQKDRQWAGVRPPAEAMRSALGIITAFTVGHSVTLAVGAVGAVSFSTRWVESLVALSIIVSALHVMRPLFSGREGWIAGSFGLIHGLAFAQALEVLHLAPQDRVAALFGFNLGIELVQMVLALAFLPMLYWGLQYPAHHKARKLVGGLALILGLAWQIRAYLYPM